MGISASQKTIKNVELSPYDLKQPKIPLYRNKQEISSQNNVSEYNLPAPSQSALYIDENIEEFKKERQMTQTDI